MRLKKEAILRNRSAPSHRFVCPRNTLINLSTEAKYLYSSTKNNIRKPRNEAVRLFGHSGEHVLELLQHERGVPGLEGEGGADPDGGDATPADDHAHLTHLGDNLVPEDKRNTR